MFNIFLLRTMSSRHITNLRLRKVSKINGRESRSIFFLEIASSFLRLGDIHWMFGFILPTHSLGFDLIANLSPAAIHYISHTSFFICSSFHTPYFSQHKHVFTDIKVLNFMVSRFIFLHVYDLICIHFYFFVKKYGSYKTNFSYVLLPKTICSSSVLIQKIPI